METLTRWVNDDMTFPVVLTVLVFGGTAVGALLGLGAALLHDKLRSMRGLPLDWEGQD